MRIIGGERRKKKLLAVPGLATRPTTDRVKETLFNIIQARVRGAFVLDLFSGTGALGLEALSRGADRCLFVDNQKQALETCRKNIAACRFEEKSTVIQWDIARNLGCLARYRTPLDLVFMDPPYSKGLADLALSHLIQAGALAPEGLVVVEHAAGDAPVPPEGVILTETRQYGTTALSFLSPP
ncbi:16S rRNA (guanine(966)-N(2))-methyltransferase RsmD [Desulfoluna spongiiphila]|uniref:16S rRNA (Guanine966-N2)-methyltransferase n=1 Tax=Desulfoluna spongiiphila TaxID=419481 RepID=A0A1G5I2T9_9BACT|nr:16S rRNA (guanine(966)-N(2))-methyltransferase RsmD [Desulfoluna spongiiphila]SCY70347.1 16S rRNA (guanine966-N2)-methyltransferase [Desulfoluna spongiiphila]VVS92676.1 rna methyltransferase rsmd [Desulfoluna spongiiphila]